MDLVPHLFNLQQEQNISLSYTDFGSESPSPLKTVLVDAVTSLSNNNSAESLRLTRDSVQAKSQPSVPSSSSVSRFRRRYLSCSELSPSNLKKSSFEDPQVLLHRLSLPRSISTDKLSANSVQGSLFQAIHLSLSPILLNSSISGRDLNVTLERSDRNNPFNKQLSAPELGSLVKGSFETAVRGKFVLEKLIFIYVM